jgi:hypothetical protein
LVCQVVEGGQACGIGSIAKRLRHRGETAKRGSARIQKPRAVSWKTYPVVTWIRPLLNGWSALITVT